MIKSALFKWIFIYIFCFASFQVSGEDPDPKPQNNWKISGKNSFLLNQTSFSNWVGGDNSSVTGTLHLDYKLDFTRQSVNWNTRVKLGYGLNYQSGRLDETRKTEDYINLSSIYGIRISKSFFVSFHFELESQFSEGYKYESLDSVEVKRKTSGFMAPGYINFGPGLKFKKSENFWVNFSPLNSKLTIVTDNELSETGAFGVTKGKHFRYELGAMGQVFCKVQLMKNVSLEQQLQVFSNILDKPQHLDFDYEASINMKVNNLIGVKAGLTLKYDYDTKIFLGTRQDTEGNEVKRFGRRVQIKQVFGVGVNLNF